MRSLLLCSVAFAATSGASLNPVTRVAELLEGLAKKVQIDGEAEQELYDKYKCWCTKVINAKTTSIAANEARIQELAAYIDDLSSGRIELTSEREELEAEIKELEKAIEEETAMRSKENEDYLAAKDEMDKAIAALESAVATLETAQTNGTALNSMSSELKKIAKLGSGFLAKKDVEGLMKALQPDVPDADWEKLNREATFKQKYQSRSGNILDILKDMTATFIDNRDAAIEAEEKAVENFDALMASKGDQLDAAKQALLDKSKEKGARAEALATSTAEKEDREGQNDRDQGFLSDTKDACETKAEEWAERVRLRTAEIASINEAISVLRSDDARDTFKKSFDSQGFLQTQATKKHHTRRSLALSAIRKAAVKSKDARMQALSTMLAMEEPAAEVNMADPFKDVIASVDTMLEDLKKEEADDLAKKEHCEKERTEKTQEAKMTSKEIDTNTETIDRLTAQIAAANKSIEVIDEEIVDLNSELQDASDQRAKETAKFTADKADDEAAVGLIETAAAALEKFYTDNSLKLVQVRRQPFVEAGEAPTPPPSTWDSGYTGSQGESQGITAILTMIKEDIQKDIAKAEAEEAAAQTAFEKFEADTQASVEKLQGTKSDLESTIAADEESITQEKTEKGTNQETLDSTLQFLKELAPGCDFIAVNFETRLKNRQIEMDGLNQAKAVLQGASFS
jgi:DNA repair exonuclease SbcCD ATPase subunit